MKHRQRWARLAVIPAATLALLAGALVVLRGGGTWTTQLGIVVAYAGLAGICGTLATAAIVDGYGDRLWQVIAIGALLSLAVASVVVMLTVGAFATFSSLRIVIVAVPVLPPISE